MKRLVAPVAILLCLPSAVFAQVPQITVTWSPVGSGATAAVPALGSPALLTLAVLVAVVGLRLLKNRGAALHSVLMLAVGGSLAVAALRVAPVESGISAINITAPVCEAGSDTYAAVPSGPPPTFQNDTDCALEVDFVIPDPPSPACILVEDLMPGQTVPAGGSGNLPYFSCGL